MSSVPNRSNGRDTGGGSRREYNRKTITLSPSRYSHDRAKGWKGKRERIEERWREQGNGVPSEGARIGRVEERPASGATNFEQVEQSGIEWSFGDLAE